MLKRLVLSFWFAAAAASVAAQVQVDDAQVKRPLPGRTMTAGYMSLTNTSAELRQLVGLRSAAVRSIEMHKTEQRDGRARMIQQVEVALPPGKTINFEPGGLHLMLFGADLPEGDSVDIELCFDDDSHQQVSFSITSW